MARFAVSCFVWWVDDHGSRRLEVMHVRVAIVIGQLNYRCGPSVDGIRLVRQLRRMGREVALVHCTPPGEADASLLDELAATAVPLQPRHPLDPRQGLDFAHHLRTLRPDVAVFKLPTAMYNLAPVAHRMGVRTVYMAGNVLQYNAGWMQRTLPWLCNRCVDFLAGCSQEVVRSFVEAGYRGPTGRIPLGVEWPDDDSLRRARLLIRGQMGFTEDDVVFCTVGRLVADKQQIHLLRACRELRDRGERFRLIVVGDGTARSELEAYCREEGLTEQVRFVGWQTDVFAYLAAAEAFLFHSTDTAEGLGVVNLEAAAVGLPLILADLRCLREVWPHGDGVMFAPVGDAAAFADRMGELIASPELRRGLGDAAAKKVRAEYSCEAMARAYLDVFEELTA